MAILLYAENANGSIKKATLQAATVAKTMADASGDSVVSVTFGTIGDDQLKALGQYGVSKALRVEGSEWDKFNDVGFTGALSEVADQVGANVIVMAHSYDGRALGPRVSIRRDSALFSAITSVPAANGSGFSATRMANSGKGVESISTDHGKLVVTVKPNSVKETESPGDCAVEAANVSSSNTGGAQGLEVVKASSKISITEADTVVSGGRGFKGPENWHILEDLATALEAGTACSKPVSDMDWRPHHEHVGQTGIQIGPNLYFAIGISGAIQHLAGVNSSKNIVVINKDPEAPFFKIADYGIIGDLFDVVPKLTEAVKKVKAGA